MKPNPAQDWVEISKVDLDRVSDVNAKRSINLINSEGKIVQTVSWTIDQPSKIINTTDLSSGVYFVMLLENNKPVQTEQLVIKK